MFADFVSVFQISLLYLKKIKRFFICSEGEIKRRWGRIKFRLDSCCLDAVIFLSIYWYSTIVVNFFSVF